MTLILVGKYNYANLLRRQMASLGDAGEMNPAVGKRTMIA